LKGLWSTIGFEYNRKRRALGNAAIQYIVLKHQRVEARQAVAKQALAMAAAGIDRKVIFSELTGTTANQRFIERSLYEGRRTNPRVGNGFPTFEEFKASIMKGLSSSGMVWDRIAYIEPSSYQGSVYDFTMDHPDHNFIANGFVVSNCGVRLLSSRISFDEAESHLDTLASALNEYCPSGVGSKSSVQLSEAELDRVCREGSAWALKQGYASQMDLLRTEEGGRLAGADPSQVSKRAKERGRPQLGTLGAGNHFIEVEVVDEIFDLQAAQVMGLQAGSLVVQIHCGSRGFGHQVCSDYVEDFQSAVRRYKIQLPDRELVCAPLDSPEGKAYLSAMRCAANYAFANRQLLAHNARQAFEHVFAGSAQNWGLYQVYDIAHNMGKIETHVIEGERIKVCVHRKGATRAFGPGFEGLPEEYRAIGQPVLVPGSMGTASWVLVGTQGSMERSFGSSCHGAGRVMSRAQAKKKVWGEDLRNQLESGGIHVRAGSMAGLAEEAPQAYKDVDDVVQTVSGAGIARKVARLVPVAVIKG
jgi:tRNA-splicing ligase RtcB